MHHETWDACSPVLSRDEKNRGSLLRQEKERDSGDTRGEEQERGRDL